MRFNFTASMKLNGMDSDRPFIREGKTSKGKDYKSFNASMSSAKNNTAFVEAFGMVQDVIKTKDADKNNIEIVWADRLDESVISSVANFRKNIADIGDVRQEFISSYDFVQFLKENYENLNGAPVCVTGNVNKDFYNGKVSNKFQINNIYMVDDETKMSMKVTAEMFFTKESFDLSEWKENKRVIIDAYTKEFIDKDNGIKFVPQQFIFDASRLNFENEKHMKLLQFRLSMLGLEIDGDKLKSKIKNSEYYSLMVVCNYVNGAEAVTEIKLEDLTETQRLAIEVGAKELKDFQPKGDLYGNRITEFRITDFNIDGDYADGMIDQGKVKELEDDIYMQAVADEDESVDEVIEKAAEESEDDEELEDLFG